MRIGRPLCAFGIEARLRHFVYAVVRRFAIPVGYPFFYLIGLRQLLTMTQTKVSPMSNNAISQRLSFRRF